MDRLFDSEAEKKKTEAVRRDMGEARRRADAVADAIEDMEEADEASQSLSNLLSKHQGVQAIVYNEYREPGGKWLIEHSEDLDNYIFQVHPIRPTTASWQDVIPMMIAALDEIFPRSIDFTYAPPNQKYKLQFYTIKAAKLTGLPGWKGAIERALVALSAVDAWPAPKRG